MVVEQAYKATTGWWPSATSEGVDCEASDETGANFDVTLIWAARYFTTVRILEIAPSSDGVNTDGSVYFAHAISTTQGKTGA